MPAVDMHPFTAHLQSDMEGLKGYLLEKVGRYALLLESV
jgi:hypothetical protein